MILSSREYDIQFKTSLYNLNHSWSEKEIDSVKVKKICLLQSKYTYSVDINFKVKKKKKAKKKAKKWKDKDSCHPTKQFEEYLQVGCSGNHIIK